MPDPNDPTEPDEASGGAVAADATGASSKPTSAAATATRVAELGPWFHNLHLPDGTQTAPDHRLGDFPAFKWRRLAPHLPADLSGWKVLDIGCNAGFYSFELARRGARVTGLDVDEHYLRQARWAAERYGLAHRTEFRRGQVYDLARSSEAFDLVLFMGVFYHLRYPLLGLDAVARRVRRLLVFQTLTMPGEPGGVDPQSDPGGGTIDARDTLLEPGWPKVAFFEAAFGGDPSNWWAANAAAVEALLRSAGLRVTARPGSEIYLCAPDPDGPTSARRWTDPEFRAAAGLGDVPGDVPE